MRKLIRVVTAALVLVAGGLGVREALQQASVAEGMTCGDWQDVIDNLENHPDYLSISRIIKESCPGLTYKIECADMGAAGICIKGQLHSHGQSTNLDVTAPKADLFRCNPAEGTPIPCIDWGGGWWKKVRDQQENKPGVISRVKMAADNIIRERNL